MKTTALRLEDELYAQLLVVAQLESQNVTDAVRTAVMEYIDKRKATLSSHADVVLAEIEREAAMRRQAITALFGGGDSNSADPTTTVEGDEAAAPSSTRGRTRKDSST